MTKKMIRSRILEHFKKDLLIDLYNVCKSIDISDNNYKTDMMIAVLNKHELDYVELGPGTNRLAILIDNYVFKIALDKWGIQDNLNEFTMSDELQPYVIKVYETNELILACEYITVISKEEFIEQKENLQAILAILAESYLLGDVGTVPRNYLNWGYRDNGDLVILDFAYIYRINGDELLCSACGQFVEYDTNFHDLKCPKCNKKYTFIDLRKKISMEIERNENYIAKQMAFKLTKPLMEVETNSMEEVISNKQKEENDMKKDRFLNTNDFNPDEAKDKYLEALESLPIIKTGNIGTVPLRDKFILPLVEDGFQVSWGESDENSDMKNYAEEFTTEDLVLLEYLKVSIDELFFISAEAKDKYLNRLRGNLNEEEKDYLNQHTKCSILGVPEDIIFAEEVDSKETETTLTEEQLRMLKNLKTTLSDVIENNISDDGKEKLTKEQLELLTKQLQETMKNVSFDFDSDDIVRERILEILESVGGLGEQIIININTSDQLEINSGIVTIKEKETREIIKQFPLYIPQEPKHCDIKIDLSFLNKNPEDLNKAYEGRNVEVLVTDVSTCHSDNDSLSINIFNPTEQGVSIPQNKTEDESNIEQNKNEIEDMIILEELKERGFDSKDDSEFIPSSEVFSTDDLNTEQENTTLEVHDLGSGVTVLTESISSSEQVDDEEESEDMKKLREELGLN